VSRFAILFGRGARSLFRVIGQTGEFGLIFDEQRVIIGSVEDVFRKPGLQRGQLFLDFSETRLVRVAQFGTAETEVTYRVLDNFLARWRISGVVGAELQCFVFGEQRQVLRQLGPELGDLGLVVVVSGTQFGRVDYGVQVTDDTPGAAQ